ncbi:type II toxin-antitoxin system VapB family antitoxin [Salmonirosea aquatica]
MKTNVEINEKLLQDAMMLSGAKTAEEVINKALDHLIYKLALKKLEAARGPELWQGDLEQMRGNTNNQGE